MDPLHRFIVISRATASDKETLARDMAHIVEASQRNNGADGLTSNLAYHAGQFIQVIEGPQPSIGATFERIRQDRRHEHVVLAYAEAIATRASAGEAMALVATSAEARHAFEALRQRSGGLLADAAPGALMRIMQEPDVIDAAPSPVAGAARDGHGLDAGRVRAALDDVMRDRTPPQDDPEHDAMEAVLATALFSAEGTLVRANANYCALLGLRPSAVQGSTHASLAESVAADELAQAWSALARGETVGLERRARRADGSDVWLESTFRPRLDASGRLRDVVELAVDRTCARRWRADNLGQVEAIAQSQAVVHLDLDGTVRDANPLFLDALGYSLDEVRGRPHHIFVPEGHAKSEEYRAFWADLAAGRPRASEARYRDKAGHAVWLQASYNPILDPEGRPSKVVAFATVVTEAKLRHAELQSQIAAVQQSRAVATYDIHGVILDANHLFLDAFGYTRDEIQGHHHRMFVDPSFAHGADYAALWRRLAAGSNEAGLYKCFDKHRREVWLQATYNPILDVEGRPSRVIQYATVVTEERLLQAEHQGQIAAIHSGQCVISFDLDGLIIDANENFLRAVGYRLSEVRGRHHRMFVEPDEAASDRYKAFWSDLAAGRHRSGEFLRIGRDGRELWLQATYTPIFDMSGRPFRVVKYATDVTTEKLQRADFEGQIAAIRKSQGVVTLGLDGTILDINDVMLGVLGYEAAEIVGRSHSVLVEPAYAQSAEYVQFWAQLRHSTFASGIYKHIAKEGRPVWIQATYNPILDLHGRATRIIAFASDVTSEIMLTKAYEEAQRQVQYDSATALPNRLRLASFMGTALAEPNARLVVLYVDLDRFKPINDTYGHHAGDRVISEVADRLRRSLSSDQIVARVGGDEFVVVAPGLDDEDIEAFCQRLTDCATAPIHHDGHDLVVGLSIGVAVSPTDGHTADELLRCADAALYRSKRAGRSTYTFHSEALSDRILLYRKAVDDLRRAIAAEEFFLEYQPRFDVRSRRVRSLEALVRWHHPERGRVSPADFIPIAERSGLIMQLGAWVMRTACQTAMAWGDVGISVNVSPVQFHGEDLVAMVRTVLATTGLAASRLELEITEGLLHENADLARDTLTKLKGLGVKLAMDDFGTGYSSLSTLRSFPFDVIKIDRQFIADLDNRQGGREVVQAILGLGKALGLTVTAEGVETEQQLAALALDDCTEVQGYLLGRPIAASEVTALLASAAQASVEHVAVEAELQRAS